MAKVTKKDRAQAIFDANPSLSDNALISKFILDLDMTTAGARTYLYNCRKQPQTRANSVERVVAVNPLQAKIIAECKKVLAKAQIKYGIDFSNVTYKFKDKGLAAASAGGGRRLTFSLEAATIDWNDCVNDTIPHEIAHLVCHRLPHLGRKHDKGWKKVCIALGGSGKRCHNLELTPAKRVTYHKYQLVDERTNRLVDDFVTLGPKRHNKTMLCIATYKTTRNGRTYVIRPKHYIGPCDRG